jgi:hypothetical protein
MRGEAELFGKREGTTRREEGGHERVMGGSEMIKVHIYIYKNVIMKHIILYN